ncbi:hypothetical protein CDD83_11248 [Cordyceps sp. RAO-2017]|nr:hypothetical protein CDD83_11248 [Cordyceps sp. RAO-2017]
MPTLMHTAIKNRWRPSPEIGRAGNQDGTTAAASPTGYLRRNSMALLACPRGFAASGMYIPAHMWNSTCEWQMPPDGPQCRLPYLAAYLVRQCKFVEPAHPLASISRTAAARDALRPPVLRPAIACSARPHIPVPAQSRCHRPDALGLRLAPASPALLLLLLLLLLLGLLLRPRAPFSAESASRRSPGQGPTTPTTPVWPPAAPRGRAAAVADPARLLVRRADKYSFPYPPVDR